MILVNGVATDSVAAVDRGLAYGDGVFRTMPARGRVPANWPRHYRKLAQDCGALGIACPDEAVLAREIAQALTGAGDAVVKIIVTRGTGARGYAVPASAAPTRVVMTAPMPAYPEAYYREGVAVHRCRLRLSSQPRLAGIKHLNRLENVLARAEWSDAGIAEGLLSDEEGHVVGGTMSNLFVAEGDALVTPPITRCGVAGVTRDRVLEAAARHGVRCREETITQARLLDAAQLLLVNSVIGVWAVRECGERRWTLGPTVARVREWLDEAER